MAQYIDKTALVAEIEKLVREYSKRPTHTNYEEGLKGGRLIGYKDALLKVNTLEVKEVDLEKEYKDFVEEDPVYNKLVNSIVGKAIAKHFFELGLNTQHSSINIPNIDDILEEKGVDPFSNEAKIFKESYYMALEKFKAQKGE